MLWNLEIIIKIIILNQIQTITSSESFLNEWNDWIIIPARSETNLKRKNNSKNFSVFGVNSSDSVNSLVNPDKMETFILRTFNNNDNYNWKQTSLQLKRSETNPFEANSDLAVPLGQAIENVKTFCSIVMEFLEENFSNIDNNREKQADNGRKLKKLKKKYKKFLFPLLLAYKLKFLALIPLLMGGLVLLVGTTGMAGFFFALFTAVMSLRTENKLEVKKW